MLRRSNGIRVRPQGRHPIGQQFTLTRPGELPDLVGGDVAFSSDSSS